jgi:hypothetical protein
MEEWSRVSRIRKAWKRLKVTLMDRREFIAGLGEDLGEFMQLSHQQHFANIQRGKEIDFR